MDGIGASGGSQDAAHTIDSVKVDKLVKEFLGAQSLTILPQNRFTDAVDQFVHKDDKDAMTEFVEESLRRQQEHLGNKNKGNSRNSVAPAEIEVDHESEDDFDDDDIQERIDEYRLAQEEAKWGESSIYPSFGDPTWPWIPTSKEDADTAARTFYNAWINFSTEKDFAWVESWELNDAPDRRVRRYRNPYSVPRSH